MIFLVAESHSPVGSLLRTVFIRPALACGLIAAIHTSGVGHFGWFPSLPPVNFVVRFIVAAFWLSMVL